jgi:tetratricopeptide (TPR) repeat protein
MSTPRLAPVAVALALMLATLAAPGDSAPSRWERAKDARVGDDWDLHVKVSEWLSIPGLGLPARLEAAQNWLEEAHADTSPNVRLRFDLGVVYEQLKHHERAVSVLAPALAAAPDHPAAADAWIELAYAYAYLDRSRDELTAYDAYLARSPSVIGRATALLNRAEAEMRLGNLEDAIAGYRDAIAVAESISNVTSLNNDDALSHWGLAVALDRSGDLTGGARVAAQAARLDPGVRAPWPAGSIIGNETSVFFVPRYERFYYLGLGMIEHAKQAPDPRGAAALWGKAEFLWAQYVAGAEAWNTSHKDRPDRWLSLAKAHLTKAQKQRLAAEKRVRSP